jgi:hypothetical protein
MQTSCLWLMGKKLLVALTMEGKFASEGLQSIDEDDDMLSVARELVERNGVGETADSVWRALSIEHQKLSPTTSHSDDDASSIEMPGGGDRNHSRVGGEACGSLSRNKRHYSALVDVK